MNKCQENSFTGEFILFDFLVMCLSKEPATAARFLNSVLASTFAYAGVSGPLPLPPPWPLPWPPAWPQEKNGRTSAKHGAVDFENGQFLGCSQTDSIKSLLTRENVQM